MHAWILTGGPSRLWLVYRFAIRAAGSVIEGAGPRRVGAMPGATTDQFPGLCRFHPKRCRSLAT